MRRFESLSRNASSGGRPEWRSDVAVILSREATKGSLSIQGFYGRGAKAILSLAPLAQDDAAGAVTMTPEGLSLAATTCVSRQVNANADATRFVHRRDWC